MAFVLWAVATLFFVDKGFGVEFAGLVVGLFADFSMWGFGADFHTVAYVLINIVILVLLILAVVFIPTRIERLLFSGVLFMVFSILILLTANSVIFGFLTPKGSPLNEDGLSILAIFLSLPISAVLMPLVGIFYDRQKKKSVVRS